MWILAILPVFAALASAAEYSAVDPPPAPNYVPEKPAPPPISAPALAIIAKILEALQGYESDLAAPAGYGDAVYPEKAYSDSDLLKLLNLAPKKYGPKTTLKILKRLPGVYGGLPGVYGGLPPYALHPSILSAAYKRAGYAAPPHVNLLYPPGLPGYAAGLPGYAPGLPGYAPGLAGYAPGLPGYAPGLPAYHLPLHPASKLPLSPAGAYGYPGYGPSALGLPALPILVITKEDLESYKVDDYEDESVVEEAAPVVYAAKPKKPAVKLVVPVKKLSPSYVATKVKVVPKPAKVYAKAAKAKAYAKVVKVAAPVKVAKLYPATAAPVIYADEVIAPAAPAYVAPATELPDVDPYSGVEARSASGGESKKSLVSAVSGDAGSAKNADSSSDVGESARTLLTENGISAKQPISRIS